MARGYQEDFYLHSQRVRDRASRQRKADKIMRALSRHLQQPAALCLDIGCSSGLVTAALAPLFEQIIGLDYDQLALQEADSSARARVQFVRGDAMHLPFGDSAIDVIICAQVYEHVPDDVLLFREIYRVLKPGGVLFFSGPNWLFPIEPHYFLPFLHWLPAPLADLYLRASGQGNHYYERLRNFWSLRTLARDFVINDVTPQVLETLPESHWVQGRIDKIPPSVWKAILPFFPNFNWILYKPKS